MPAEALSTIISPRFHQSTISRVRSESDLGSSTLDIYSQDHLSLFSSTPSTPSSYTPQNIMQINTRTPAMMPAPRAKEAPPKFTGKFEDIPQALQ